MGIGAQNIGMAVVGSSYLRIGNTPMVRLNGIEKAFGLQCALYGKVESANPSGSVKDRAALYMILDAERKGILKPGGTIIEPTSGNTGIGIASVAAAKGYHAIIVMPETMSLERRKLIAAYGAEIVLTPGKGGMAASVEEAKRLQEKTPGAVVLGQFDNPANALAHYETTGPEIYHDLEGRINAFVAGIGTGGTVTGVGRFLKEKDPKIHVIGVEPASSPLLTKGTAGPHAIQGIGANFVPSLLDRSILDEVVDISNEDAFAYARAVASKEGFLVGISSGAALAAAVGYAKKNPGQSIVVLFPDGGDRYLSTDLYQ